MPPHARMSLSQQLLIRALIARFWESPYRQPLVRWGTELHDRFMLPHFVDAGLPATCSTSCARPGYPLEPSGSRRTSSSASRCFGQVAYARRRARAAAGDRALARAGRGDRRRRRRRATSIRRSSGSQVKVRGMTDARHVVTCNGRRVPLHPTGTQRRVRRRRALPRLAAAVLPAPDDSASTRRWSSISSTPGSGRSLGGCTYHVVASRRPALRHVPGQRQRGREPPDVPVLRRSATRPARCAVPPEERNPEAPAHPRPAAAVRRRWTDRCRSPRRWSGGRLPMAGCDGSRHRPAYRDRGCEDASSSDEPIAGVRYCVRRAPPVQHR